MYTLDKRCQKILRTILYTDGYIKVQDIADQMGVSRRSAYYDIRKIDEWLEENDIDPLNQVRGKGIYLKSEQKERIKAVLYKSGDTHRQSTYQIYTPEERYHIEICSTITRQHEMYIEDFMDICDVSRNTIIHDLKNVTMILQSFNLNLVYSIKSGYMITGNVIKKRAVFFLYFPQLWNLYMQDIFTTEEKEQIQSILKALKDIEHDLHAEYVSGTLPTLATFIAFIDKRTDTEQLSFPDMDVEEIKESQEYMLIQEYLRFLPENEKIYITLHLLGSRLQTYPVHVMKENPEVYEVATKLVSEFTQLSGIYYENVDELINAIAAHFSTSIYRFHYGIQLGNPFLDNIKNEYSELFELTKTAYRLIQNDIGIMISDAEIAYLTLHFGAFMESSHASDHPYRILIICPNGIGAGKMLKTEVSALVPQATEITNISLNQYHKDHHYDVVISTIYLEDEENLIVVNPILNDQDRISILRKCMHAQPHERIQIENIVNIAKQYISGEHIKHFQRDLENYFASTLDVHKAPPKNYGLGLKHYLRSDHIITIHEETTWDDAIIRTCQPLLLSDAITQDYIDAILADQKEKGLYMFLTEGLVLAHTASEHGVKHVDVALATCKKPVRFLNGREAKVIIALCAEDQNNHIRILNDILRLFTEKENLDIMSQLERPEDVYAFITQKIN